MGRHNIINEWLIDMKYFTMKNVSYYIYKTPISKNVYLLSNLNFNITDLNLKTNNLHVAKKRAEIIINNKIITFDNAVNKLSRLTNRLKKKSCKYMPQMTDLIFDINEDIENINNF